MRTQPSEPPASAEKIEVSASPAAPAIPKPSVTVSGGRRAPSVESPENPPAILFVDEVLMTPFVQLAVTLKRAGYRTIRVTTARSRKHFLLLRRIAFDCIIRLDLSDLEHLDEILQAERIIDVQCVARLAPVTYRALDRLPSCDTSTGWRSRSVVVDKLTVSRLLEKAGVTHPPSLGGDTTPAEAVQALGLPLVMKPRVGSSGFGVTIARTLAELEGLHGNLSDPSSVFFEAFVEGAPINYGAVVGPDGAERDMTYQTVRRGLRAWSPSIEITCEQDETFIEIGRRLARALPSEGLLNVDAIQDCTGRYWVHDVNLPVWGAFFASREVGFDLTAAYLRWLSDQKRHAAGDSKRPLRIFPAYLGTVLRSEQPRRALHSLRSDIREYCRWLGWTYVLYELKRSALALSRPRRRGAPTAMPTSESSPISELDN